MHCAAVSSGVGPFHARLFPLPAHNDALRNVRKDLGHTYARLGRCKEQLRPAWRAALRRARQGMRCCVSRRGDRWRGGRRQC